ncbi:MORC family CW-type zinc finger protein 3-like [Physella acuta]|uniref:MORC family CW-type zinc finger protein 3-like n=1 Tax=Physella acuta TaxID=109671 RepID=UPI0027DBE6DA|nr:MORC family CW-type zinc finger protein 3-like [Physella acuta]
MSPDNRSGVPQSKVHPKFLHSNSTSHTWAFSAIAELIDNAYDPDVKASALLIDKVDINDKPCLVFLDNGTGMDYDQLHNMLSFGFCEKGIYENNETYKPIGQYGNGFKSGSMRLGKDALVFTRCKDSTSIGFLSQTFLDATKADTVLVPLIEYKLSGHILFKYLKFSFVHFINFNWEHILCFIEKLLYYFNEVKLSVTLLKRDNSQGTLNCLKQILTYSIFNTEDDLIKELNTLENSRTGTKIIIYNLNTIQDVTLELDFASDPKDIRCPETHQQDSDNPEDRPVASVASEYTRSLREYCRILFQHPRMKIQLRGAIVRSKIVARSLYQTEVYKYKPAWLNKHINITVGFSCERERGEDYGMMLYHRNRLITAYEKVGYQKQANEKGVGVVGVADVSFLTATHNKQDFEKDKKFISVMKAIAEKLNDYWDENASDESNSAGQAVTEVCPDWTWVQCDLCLKWRRLPLETQTKNLPDKWFCRFNTDSTHNRCDVPQEELEEDGVYMKKKNKQKSKNKKTAKKGKTQKRAIPVLPIREVRYPVKGLPSDKSKPLPTKRKSASNTENVHDDSDETAHSSRKKSLRSSSSKTEITTVYKARRKTSPFDKHCDDVDDEPETIPEKTSELRRSTSESSFEGFQFELNGKPNHKGRSSGPSCNVDLALDPSAEDTDNNDNDTDGNDETNSMSSSEVCSRVDKSQMPSSSFVTESLHQNTDKRGSEINQRGSDEMKNMKIELAQHKEKIKQLEDRLSKFSYSVRKLLRLTLPKKYHDGTLDNIEDDIGDIISKIAAQSEMTLMPDNVDDEIEEMIRTIDDSNHI